MSDSIGLIRTARGAIVGALSLAALLASPAPVRAQPGELDRTFASDGLRRAFPAAKSLTRPRVVASRKGRLVVAGASQRAFELARYDRRGRLDRAFGKDGRVRTRMVRGTALLDAVALPGGGLVAVGQSGTDLALAAYRANGRPNRSFSGNGRLRLDLGGNCDRGSGVAPIPGAGLAVAGFAGSCGGRADPDGDFVVLRLSSNGELDRSFGSDGLARPQWAPATNYSYANDVIVEPDGGIVAAGVAASEIGLYFSTEFEFALARLHPDGAPDQSFGGDGTVTTDFEQPAFARAIVHQPDGAVVAVGSGIAARYLPSGSLDPSFGGDGYTERSQGMASEYGDVALDAAGRLVIAGSGAFPADNPLLHEIDPAVVRLLPDGAPDPAFGTGGIARIEARGSRDEGTSVALVRGGKIATAARFGRIGDRTLLARLHGR